jgi:sigma-B regulation protein RsbU (phosphoserine phosphatase)
MTEPEIETGSAPEEDHPPTKRGVSISVKLIMVSMALLVAVIGLFGVINSIQSARIIDDSSRRLEANITQSLRRAGRAQLRLMAATARISLVQSDYTTLQTIVHDIGVQDDLVTEAAVVERSGKILAHTETRRVGTRARHLPADLLATTSLKVRSGVLVGNKETILFAAPVKHDAGTPCTVVIAYSLAPLRSELSKAEQQRHDEVAGSFRNTVLVGLLAIAFGVVLTILQGFRISRPIRALASQADKIASGDLEARVEITTQDEIGQLGDRFNYMAERVVVLMEETKEKASIERELEVAANIQTTLVPEQSDVELSGIKLAGYYRPAAKCGGDWWYYYQTRDGRVVLLVGDVTGHGVPSAMITAVVKGAATNMVAVMQDDLDLPLLLRELDAVVHEAGRGKLFMTCFASVFDPTTSTITFANAAHPFPLVYQAGARRFTSMVIRGDRLGDLAAADYKVDSIQLEHDDVVVWFTDGIVEAKNAAGEEYREKRLRAAIRSHFELAPEQARDEIIGRFHNFLGELPYEDDITLVVSKISRPAER